MQPRRSPTRSTPGHRPGRARLVGAVARLGLHPVEGRWVVTEDDLTEAQRRIVDAAQSPATPVPADLSGEDLARWFMDRALAAGAKPG